MKLVWSRYALRDRDTIFSYIEADNPHAAIRIDEQIEAAARQLIAFPDSGRPGRIPGTRELIIPRTPYILAYAVNSDTRARAARIARRSDMAGRYRSALTTDRRLGRDIRNTIV